MSNIVVLTPHLPRPVRIKTNTYELTNQVFDIKGQLNGFKVNNVKYIFIDKTKYLSVDQVPGNDNTIVTGFVKYDSYINYMNDPNKGVYNYTYIIDPVHWFDLILESSQRGDLFKISKLETSSDSNKTDNYTKYFIFYNCEFKITNPNLVFSNSANYPPIQLNDTLPTYCKIDWDDRSSSAVDSSNRNFFKKNLGSKIATFPTTFTNQDKEMLYIGMVKICWRIKNLFEDVLDMLAIKNLSEILNIVQTANPPAGTDIRSYIYNSTPTLSDIDKAIAILLIDWGYRNYNDTLEIFPLNSFEYSDFENDYYMPFQNYYNTLVNIYINIAYSKEEYLFGVTSDPSGWSVEFTKAQSNLRLEMLVSIIPDGAVNFLTLDAKIKILRKFAENSIYESREDSVVKIVKSIQVNDALAFLNRLETEKILINGNQKTLFECLYQRINDRIVFFGKNNRREYMNRLYSLWYVSMLNPYQSLAIGLGGIDYNTSQYYFEQFYKNKPIILNYNSKKNFLGFFVDNMDFEFNGELITVKEEKVTGYTISGGEPTPDISKVKVGDYGFYTAISLMHYDEKDVAVKLPSIALQPSGSDLSYVIPLFYLKYLDDFGDSEDVWTAVDLTADVALSFTGIGNISKLRHFRHLSKLGRIALGASITTGERILALEALSGAGALIELTSDVAKSILNYYSNGCEVYIDKVKANINDSTPDGNIPENPGGNTIPNYDWCKNLDNFLFWTQMVSSGGGFAAEYMMRDAAVKLMAVNNSNFPAGFPQAAADFIRDIADLDAALNSFYAKIQPTCPTVVNKVKSFIHKEDRYAFMLEFRDHGIPYIQQLQNEPDLIDVWIKITTSVKKHRYSINLLKARKFLNTPLNTPRMDHVFHGEVDTSFTPPKASGFHHIYGIGVNVNAYGKIVRTLSKNQGYALTNVEVFHSGTFYPKQAWNNAAGTHLPILNDMFRQDWDREEIIDNIALAYTTLTYSSGNKFVGAMSDNKHIIICIRGGNDGLVGFLNKGVITSWPSR